MKEIRIIWPDGQTMTAGSYREVLDDWRADQWHVYSHRGFRREMANRAGVYAGQRVRISGSSRAFLRRLEGLDMFRIEEGEDQ